MIEVAIENEKPVRIGVNWGSLDQALLTRMMDENAKLAEPLDARDVMMEAMVAERAATRPSWRRATACARDRIILSAKVSGVQDLIDVYRELAARCDYPLHLGLTEAGMGAKGIVAAPPALAVLLQEGIGDTIRVSLTPAPEWRPHRRGHGRRSRSCSRWGFAASLPQVTACPGCGRTTSTFFQEMAEQIQTYLREQMPVWKTRYPGVEEMKVAVMGCVVNGPGESKHCQHRHLAAGNVRGAEGAGVRRRPPDDDAERRQHRRRVHQDPRRVRRVALRPQAATGHQQLGPF